MPIDFETILAPFRTAFMVQRRTVNDMFVKIVIWLQKRLRETQERERMTSNLQRFSFTGAAMEIWIDESQHGKLLSAEAAPPAGFWAKVAARRTAPLRGFPDVMGLELTAASKRIAVFARSLPTLRFTTRLGDMASERPENLVLEQAPAPGGTPFGDTVTLRVARNLFPDVLCQNLDRAQGMIKEATPGRTVTFTVEKQISGLEPGTVLEQRPLPSRRFLPWRARWKWCWWWRGEGRETGDGRRETGSGGWEW